MFEHVEKAFLDAANAYGTPEAAWMLRCLSYAARELAEEIEKEERE